MSTRLFIRTRSVPTCAAIWLITGTAPEVLKRPNGDVCFQFPPEAEAALEQFLAKKDAVDQLLQNGRSA